MAERINWRVLRDADSIRIDLFPPLVFKQLGVNCVADIKPEGVVGARAILLAVAAKKTSDMAAVTIAVDEAFAEAFA